MSEYPWLKGKSLEEVANERGVETTAQYIRRLIKERNEATAELERLRALIEKLPEAFDGDE